MSNAFLQDAAERIIATLVVAALGSLSVWLAAGAPMGKVALIAALTPIAATLYDVVKVILARFTGNPNSASLVK